MKLLLLFLLILQLIIFSLSFRIIEEKCGGGLTYDDILLLFDVTDLLLGDTSNDEIFF
jgi:hypothetical protein